MQPNPKVRKPKQRNLLQITNVVSNVICFDITQDITPLITNIAKTGMIATLLFCIHTENLLSFKL